jgi:hypothetical protein
MFPKFLALLKKAKSWHYALAGVTLGLLVVGLLFKKLYCFYAFQPNAQFVTGGLVVLGGIAGAIAKFIRDKEKISFKNVHKVFVLACGLFISVGVVIFLSPLLFQMDKNSCVDGFDQLVGLIRQEEQAALTKDMTIIKEIYTPDAVVTNAETKQPSQAYMFYSLKFAELDYCSATHGHFETVEFSTTEVIMTTSSLGTWGKVGKGCTEVYNNPPGSDQWSFVKVAGKWKIQSFEFNRKK